MFEKLKAAPADPILGLTRQFAEDLNPLKINLSIGVYQDESGNTPIFPSVKRAERQLHREQDTKAYISQAGDERFNAGISRLLLGERLLRQRAECLATIMTPGGCGALSLAAGLLAQSAEAPVVWVSDPTWPNHPPIFEGAGVRVRTYPYYDRRSGCLDFERLVDALGRIPPGQAVLLHGCCHNPTGFDPTPAQWDVLADLLLRRRLLPLLDVAYQGLGQGIADDAYGVRRILSRLPEAVVAVSCSKNFGLYRERTGALVIASKSPPVTRAAASRALATARSSYSMAPYHGAGVVGLLLSDQGLRRAWKSELKVVRERIQGLRTALVDELARCQSAIDFGFLRNANGMFCLLGLSAERVRGLRRKRGLYLVDDGRLNVAALSNRCVKQVAEWIAGELGGPPNGAGLDGRAQLASGRGQR